MTDLWKRLNLSELFSSMICSIHQPNYIPYLWLFHKLAASDIFVFYDTAQYTKGDYHNRNTIKWPNGPILLSLPVQVSLWQKITEARFDARILEKHKKTIQESYRKAPYLSEVHTIIEEMYSYTGSSLAEFNIATITKLASLLAPNVKLILLSDVLPNLETKSTEALLDICHAVKATKYISWAWGKGYLDSSLFLAASIGLEFQDFHHPVYPQLWWEFLPYMSIIDALYNVGIEGTQKLIAPMGI